MLAFSVDSFKQARYKGWDNKTKYEMTSVKQQAFILRTELWGAQFAWKGCKLFVDRCVMKNLVLRGKERFWGKPQWVLSQSSVA